MRMAVRLAIGALVLGVVLIVLGTVVIEGARHLPTSEAPPGSLFFVAYVWDTFQLAAGIVLALVGTATSTASLTYLLLSRKKKGV